MTREELIRALAGLPSGTQVELQLGGWYFEMVDVQYDVQRSAGVVLAFQVGEDPARVHDSVWKSVPQRWRPTE